MTFIVKTTIDGLEKEIKVFNCDSEYHAMVKLQGYINKNYPNKEYSVIHCKPYEDNNNILDNLKSIFGI